MNNKGIIIVFEGIDQSGKGTQAKLFVESLRSRGFSAEYLHFHDTSTPIGKELQLFFEGDREFSPIVRQLLFTANRYERNDYISESVKNNDFIIIDRYIPSGLAYGIANGIEIDWMLNLESHLNQPDIVVLLDISSNTSKKRKAEENRDVYEKDLKFLEKVRKIYLKLANTFDWIIIDGTANTDEVQNMVMEKVKEKLNNKGLYQI